MITRQIKLATKGNCDIINITPYLEGIVSEENISDGIMFLNVIGSTAAISTMEFEPGLKADIKAMWEELIPEKKHYKHNLTWSDDNGHSHLRSFLLKTNFFVTVTGSRLDLGTWQQVVLLDFDIRPRKRTIVAKILI